MNKKLQRISIAILALSVGGGTALAIDFVNIGNAGNAADSTGYGSVGYNYQISRAEITIAQFAASGVGNGNEGIGIDPNAPVTRVSWSEAAQYANWLTSANMNNGAYTITGGLVTAVDRATAITTYGTVYVLPTEDEWYKAAYFTGSGYSLYANGTATPPGVGDANWNTGGAWIVGSGAVEQNGTVDLMGNVWEWTESAVDGNFDTIGEDIAFRGTSYFQSNTALMKSSERATDDPTLEHPSVGVRIVAIPEPGTISLMSLSTISLFLTRTLRRRKVAGTSLLPIGREYSCDVFIQEEIVAGDESDYWDECRVEFIRGLSLMGQRIHSVYAKIQKLFWNRMVVVHDLKVERRKAFRTNLKQQSLVRLDAFLARIMK